MKNNCGIYIIENKVNGHFYIGSSKSLSVRINDHKSSLRCNKHSNNHLQKAYNKYGQEHFSFNIVVYCSERHRIFYEQRFLDKYWDNGVSCYNIAKIADSPMSGKRHSSETKAKLSAKGKGRKQSPEHISRRSATHIGKHRTEQAKETMSKLKKGTRLSEEHKQNIVTSLTGRYHSEETKAKMAAAQTGKRASAETKAKQSVAAKNRTKEQVAKGWVTRRANMLKIA